MVPMTASLEDLTELAGLFLAPFLHESLAFVGGAYLVQSDRLELMPCLAALLAGVVASDLGIYGLGRLARTHRRVARLLPHAAGRGAALDRNLLWLIPLCRFVPGLLFTTFAGCGLMAVEFRRFTAVTVLTAMIYTPALLWAVLKSGAAVASPGRLWPWAAVAASLLSLTALGRWLVQRWMERSSRWPVQAG
ncbi:MAG: DedA family protein [Sphingomonadales bacterium]